MPQDLSIARDPDAAADDIRVHHSQLSGFAVIACPCGQSPLVIPTLTEPVTCPRCRTGYIVAGATLQVDPIKGDTQVDMQIGRLSSLSRPMPRRM